MLNSKMSEKRSLRYTSINDLLQRAKVDYKNKKPSEVCKRLPDMYNKAEDNGKHGNEEDKYIMLTRWLKSIEWLQTTREYKNDKIYSLTDLSVNQINEVKKILAELNRRLDTRYKQQAKTRITEKNNSLEKMEIDNDAVIDSIMSQIDGPIELPETPTRDPLAGDNEEIISCEQLFQLVQDIYGRYLIIDIRSKSQFDNSRIRSNKYINIPSTEIKTGLLASHFEKHLRKDKKALELYRHRGAQHVDVTVLLDWNTSSKTLSLNNPLNVLRKILENWDPGIQHKKITILDGGYTEWLTRYPAYTTNPNITTEPKLNNIADEILDTIEYPEWIHFDEEENLNKTREKKMLGLKSINKDENARTNVSTNDVVYKYVDKEISNNVPTIKSNNLMNNGSAIKNNSVELDRINIGNDVWKRFNKGSLNLEPERKLNIRKKSDVIVKPTVDRSNKPVLLDASTSEAKAVLKLLRQLNELAKMHIRLQQDILEQERALCMQYSSEYKVSNEEEFIRRNLESLCRKLEEKKKEYEKLEDDLDNYYSRTEPIEFTTAEDIEKRNLEINLASAKLDMKNIAKARKKLGEKTAKNEFKEPPKEVEPSIHKEPLKSESSSTIGSGLERSYSSPNLLQLIDRKAPRVDRTSKPQIPLHSQNGSLNNENKVSHVSWANREERMTPVHGSVHPGITGLKNLGNSCYMNSIIQCLSNTTHLAKYFTDNLYTDDLNTNNDNNMQGQVVEEVAQVIKALWRGQYKSISPHDLKIAVGQYRLQFESYEQQDSHEFLTFLLDWMHNDLKRKRKVPLDMTVAEEAWNKAMQSMKSIISDLFFGQLRSTITCSFCKESSTTYESFNSLTTSLPQSSRCALNDCILRFVTGQKVVGWKCPKCQTPREAMKKFDFVKLAPIVVIHLNRFGESGGWLEKRNTAVDFPLTDFNLKSYLVTDSNTPTISNIRSYNYSLYAMSNHYGTMEGGHYTAFCKNAAQNKWYKYDDQTVTEVTPNQVKLQNTSAYLLFYTSFSSNII